MGKIKIFVLLFGAFLFCSGPLVLADDHGPGGENVSHHANRHSDHYYRNGRWYHHGWFGFDRPVPVLSTGIYVNTLPPAYAPVVIQGTTYYYGDNTYFTQSSDGGYVVVSPPAH
jgi:hypothetical protein